MVEKTATPQMMQMAASMNVSSRTLRRMGPWNWLYEEKAMMEPNAIPIELNTCNTYVDVLCSRYLCILTCCGVM